jgi:HPt (histidine-containing phosphotransfer) domain-containing protein
MLEQCINKNTLCEVINSYLTESEKSIAIMRQSLAQLDFARISFENHSLRGGCGTFGADRLVVICRELSILCKAEDYDSKVQSIDTILQQLELEFINVAQFLKQRIAN